MLKEEELRECSLLVLANKQDLPNVMSAQEIVEYLELKTIRHRCWNIQATCAKNGDGLVEGLDWLSKALEQRV